MPGPREPTPEPGGSDRSPATAWRGRRCQQVFHGSPQKAKHGLGPEAEEQNHCRQRSQSRRFTGIQLETYSLQSWLKLAKHYPVVEPEEISGTQGHTED